MVFGPPLWGPRTDLLDADVEGGFASKKGMDVCCDWPASNESGCLGTQPGLLVAYEHKLEESET